MLFRIAAFVFVLSTSAFADVKIEDVPGQRDFKFRDNKATDFSGLTWVKGSGYYAVSNRVKALYPMRIELEPDGKIESAVVGDKISVKAPLDGLRARRYF